MKRITITFSARAAESLYSSLPDAKFSDQTGLVNWQRAVKSETEITYMKRAGKVIEGVYQRVMQVAEPGMRKNELVAEIYHAGVRVMRVIMVIMPLLFL